MCYQSLPPHQWGPHMHTPAMQTNPLRAPGSLQTALCAGGSRHVATSEAQKAHPMHAGPAAPLPATAARHHPPGDTFRRHKQCAPCCMQAICCDTIDTANSSSLPCHHMAAKTCTHAQHLNHGHSINKSSCQTHPNLPCPHWGSDCASSCSTTE